MKDLLIVLPFCDEDSKQCEHLVDFIALLRGKKPSGACLLVASPDSHKEAHAKITVSAKIGFEQVDMIQVGWPATIQHSKTKSVNTMFFKAAQAVAARYKVPWLWLEPDCTPLCRDWEMKLMAEYAWQPKRYMGAIMADKTGAKKSLARTSIYPPDAINEYGRFSESESPFEIVAGELIVPCATKTKLIQQLQFDSTTTPEKVRPDAVLLHSDKQQIILNRLRQTFGGQPPKTDVEELFADPTSAV